VIVTSATAAVVVAKQATSVIPIVFAAAGDPVGTAWSQVWRAQAATSPAYRFSKPMLRPSDSNFCARLSRASADWRFWAMSAVGRLTGYARGPGAARTLGLEVIASEILRGEDIAPAFEALKGRADAFYVCIDPIVGTHRIRINTLALAARLPTMHGSREFVEAGGLMSYGPNVADLFRRAGDYVDKTLPGSKPGDLPVEQPTKFDLVINLTTAKALGLTLPETLLARADEVIE